MAYDPALSLCRRTDTIQRHLVDIACCFPDVGAAARFLASYAIPFHVAHHVLLRPAARRALKGATA